jgi:hypothetical protein
VQNANAGRGTITHRCQGYLREHQVHRRRHRRAAHPRLRLTATSWCFHSGVAGTGRRYAFIRAIVTPYPVSTNSPTAPAPVTPRRAQRRACNPRACNAARLSLRACNSPRACDNCRTAHYPPGAALMNAR